MTCADQGSETSPEEDEALFCLSCNYNLRGLMGDPIRCPECGETNSRADLLLPPALVEKELRKLETLPTAGVAMMYAALFGVSFITGGSMVCAVILLVPSLMVWILVVSAFGNICEYKAGWVGALLWYHLAGLFFAAVVALAVLVVGLLDLLPDRTGRVAVLVLMATILIGQPLAKRLLKRLDLQVRIWNPYAIAKAKLHDLSRELAVERAQRRRRLILEAERARSGT